MKIYNINFLRKRAQKYENNNFRVLFLFNSLFKDINFNLSNIK